MEDHLSFITLPPAEDAYVEVIALLAEEFSQSASPNSSGIESDNVSNHSFECPQSPLTFAASSPTDTQSEYDHNLSCSSNDDDDDDDGKDANNSDDEWRRSPPARRTRRSTRGKKANAKHPRKQRRIDTHWGEEILSKTSKELKSYIKARGDLSDTEVRELKKARRRRLNRLYARTSREKKKGRVSP